MAVNGQKWSDIAYFEVNDNFDDCEVDTLSSD